MKRRLPPRQTEVVKLRVRAEDLASARAIYIHTGLSQQYLLREAIKRGMSSLKEQHLKPMRLDMAGDPME